MTAKEMFEKLGYEQDLNNNFYIGYYKKINNKQRMFTFMRQFKYFTFIDNDNSCVIDLKELQAINKQIEELGWLDE